MAVPPPPPLTAKAAIRRDLRARRLAFVDALGDDRARQEAALVARLEPHFAGARIVSAYVPVDDEIDSLPILAAAHRLGLATALPCVERGSETLVFRRWSPGEALVDGPMRLRQPPSAAPACRPDLILAPMLGFDRALGRIGQGKGYYDRVFADLRDARRIGLAWSVQEVAALPLDDWDLPLHGVATEREWIGPR